MKLKKFSRQFHIYVSVFLLPMALLFAITGIVYILGVNQDFGATKQKWVIEETIPQEKQFDYLIDFMRKNNISFPQNIEPKQYRGTLMIGSAKYAVTINSQEGKTIIQSIKRSFLGNMIMLHKAKAKWYFDILSIAFGLALVLFYVSGVIMTAFCKNNRKEILISLVLGFIVTAILAYISL
ncbi:PepSY domain-containing protein [Helicobacter cappadocius]|uniref:PepSY domain-containing protein n=1 Tax=Helicobacter cappadocius TaxID=3063998 RepID=A0AA90SSB7_9HELI|nr:MULTISPECIES: PepSY domain-containing protein [unclassified Helicobacter]MDO7253160.1 PepSY domain-containing protein [Helicobacter sp. faydin-H75]MDP2538714.1 PepSY domain-containing protein [Helicobacter sp. faydin-H76]